MLNGMKIIIYLKLALISTMLMSICFAERWDITLQDNVEYSNINRAWIVGASLFVVIDKDFNPVNIADIKSIKQYRQVKTGFNRRRAWSHTQIYGIVGALVGVLVGTSGSDDQAVKMQQGIKISLISGLLAGGTGFVVGGIKGRKRTRVVYHDLSELSPKKKMGKIRYLLENASK